MKCESFLIHIYLVQVSRKNGNNSGKIMENLILLSLEIKKKNILEKVVVTPGELGCDMTMQVAVSISRIFFKNSGVVKFV